jgi:hypothetical protein
MTDVRQEPGAPGENTPAEAGHDSLLKQRAGDMYNNYSTRSWFYGNIAVKNRKLNAMFTTTLGILVGLLAVRGSTNLYAEISQPNSDANSSDFNWTEWILRAWPDVLAIVVSVLERVAASMDFRGKRDAYTTAANACNEAVTCAQTVIDHNGELSDAFALTLLTAVGSAADIHCPVGDPLAKKTV